MGCFAIENNHTTSGPFCYLTKLRQAMYNSLLLLRLTVFVKKLLHAAIRVRLLDRRLL